MTTSAKPAPDTLRHNINVGDYKNDELVEIHNFMMNIVGEIAAKKYEWVLKLSGYFSLDGSDRALVRMGGLGSSCK